MNELHFKKPKTHKLQGSYKFQGLPISVENKKGGYRKGIDKDGHSWKTKMHHDYGYIRGTNGNDNESVDAYVGPNRKATNTYVVHQKKIEDIKNPMKYTKTSNGYMCKKCGKASTKCSHSYDEDKVMIGFDSKNDAEAAYRKQYDHPGFIGPVSTYKNEEFKSMLKGCGKKIPYKRLEKAFKRIIIRL